MWFRSRFHCLSLISCNQLIRFVKNFSFLIVFLTPAVCFLCADINVYTFGITERYLLKKQNILFVNTVSPGLTLQFRDYFQNSVEFKT